MFRMLALGCLLLLASTAAPADTFLILPFFNASKTANLEWIGESVSESIREALASENVIVLDRDDRDEAYRRLSIRPYSQLTTATVVVLGESLDAEQVIYGSYEFTPVSDPALKTRGSLRITAHILDLKKLSRGPEYLELGALEDLARLQTHLGWQTLQFVTPQTAPSEQEFRKRQTVLRVEAIENYVRGLLAVGYEQKLKLFGQAVRIEPQYSQANFQLGRLHWTKKNYKAAADALLRVANTDDHYREASFTLGLCRYYLGDYQGAQESFALVGQSVPLNEVLNNLGAAQLRRNNSSDALANFRKALEGDPSDPDYHFNVGYALYKQGNLVAAAEKFRAVLDRNPEDAEATTMLGRCLKSGPTALSKVSDVRADGLERLKKNYEETAYRQLKAVLEPKKH